MYNPRNEEHLKVVTLNKHHTVETKTLLRYCKLFNIDLLDNGERSDFAVLMLGSRFIGLVRDF